MYLLYNFVHTPPFLAGIRHVARGSFQTRHDSHATKELPFTATVPFDYTHSVPPPPSSYLLPPPSSFSLLHPSLLPLLLPHNFLSPYRLPFWATFTACSSLHSSVFQLPIMCMKLPSSLFSSRFVTYRPLRPRDLLLNFTQTKWWKKISLL